MTALSRAKGLEEVVRIQGGYLQGTIERMTELNRRWLELAGRMWPGVAVGEDRGGAGTAARPVDSVSCRKRWSMANLIL